MRLINAFAGFLMLITTACYTQDSRQFKARNGVNFAYEIVFPADYDKDKSYELAMVFSEIEVKNSGYAPTLAGLRNSKRLANTIFFVPKVPVKRPHWISHPIHHGLNDFMRGMRDAYGKEGQKFHFIAHMLGGRVAQTYSGMSSEYVASVSFAHSTHWDITQQQYFEEIFGRGFKVYVYDSQNPKQLSIDVSRARFIQSESFSKALEMIDARVRSL